MQRTCAQIDAALVSAAVTPLIPPTYANLTRFHGVFAPTSRRGTQVVPRPPPKTTTETTTPSAPAASAAATPTHKPARSSYRLDWAALLKRVFAVDVLECSRCRGSTTSPRRYIWCNEIESIEVQQAGDWCRVLVKHKGGAPEFDWTSKSHSDIE